MNKSQGSEVVLVTGGQGFLGQHIIRLLQEDERVKEIRVLDMRPFTNRIGFDENKVLKSYTGDVRMPESLAEPFNGVDCVIHAAALTGFATFPPVKDMEDVNVGGVRNVIHQCISANVSRLVMTSSAFVTIPKMDPLILAAEHTTPVPPKQGYLFAHYGRTKYEGECLVREANGKRLGNGSGVLSTVCLRPTLLYGELDPYYVTHALEFAKRHGGTLYRVGWGGERSQVTYAGNAAWAHILAKNKLDEDQGRRDIGGEAIFITDDTPIDNPYKFLEPFLQSQRMKLSSMMFPATLGIIFVLLLHIICRLLKPLTLGRLQNPFPHPGTLYYVLCIYCFNRLKSILRLDYKPLYTPEKSISNSIAYYKSVQLT